MRHKPSGGNQTASIIALRMRKGLHMIELWDGYVIGADAYQFILGKRRTSKNKARDGTAGALERRLGMRILMSSRVVAAV